MLLVIDVVMVTLWVILDPMQRHLQNLTLEYSPQDRGVVYQPQVTRMKQKNKRLVLQSQASVDECRGCATVIIANEP
jgi:hypothetical protein